MRTVTWVLFWLLPLAAFASKKDTADYVAGVLVSFHDIHTGKTCSSSGSVDGRENSDGSITGNTDETTNCFTNFARLYTVQIGGQVLTIERAMSGKRKLAALGTMGWSTALAHQSVLANQLPGTHFLARSDGTYLHVRIGKKETIFNIVEAK